MNGQGNQGGNKGGNQGNQGNQDNQGNGNNNKEEKGNKGEENKGKGKENREKAKENRENNRKENKENRGKALALGKGKKQEKQPQLWKQFLWDMTELTLYPEKPDYLIDPVRSVEYTYDAVGNRTQMIADGKTTHYTYDHANHQIQAGEDILIYDTALDWLARLVTHIPGKGEHPELL